MVRDERDPDELVAGALALDDEGDQLPLPDGIEEALQKALRMTDTSIDGFEANAFKVESEEELVKYLEVASDQRVYAVALALERGMSPERIHALTSIDLWFLYKLKRINDIHNILTEFKLSTLPVTTLLQAKKSGFSDLQIGKRIGVSETEVRKLRKEVRCARPCLQLPDPCARSTLPRTCAARGLAVVLVLPFAHIYRLGKICTVYPYRWGHVLSVCRPYRD